MNERAPTDRLRVRPYALTGGRVRSTTELALETIVRITDRYVIHASGLSKEGRGIGHLSEDPISIVEISARLKLPLGVVRVLVGDMVGQGLLETHQMIDTDTTADGRPDQRLLERVLHGLQTL